MQVCVFGVYDPNTRTNQVLTLHAILQGSTSEPGVVGTETLKGWRKGE